MFYLHSTIAVHLMSILIHHPEEIRNMCPQTVRPTNKIHLKLIDVTTNARNVNPPGTKNAMMTNRTRNHNLKNKAESSNEKESYTFGVVTSTYEVPLLTAPKHQELLSIYPRRPSDVASTNAHNWTTVTNILLLEFLATAIHNIPLCSL